ncbi:MAG TPA: hypothetical protein VGF94_24310 [Kofleriaceae bacterium]|jgi:hypothetical protein
MSGSKWILVGLIAAGACELEPPPKKHAAQVEPAPAQPRAPTPVIGAGSGAGSGSGTGSGTGSGSAAHDISDACMQAGVHFADVWINEAQNAQDKAALEQERTLLVRRTALGCTQQAWSDEARACVETAKTRAEMTACEKRIVNGSGAARQR